MLEEKINKKSIEKKTIKVKMHVGMDFGWLLGRFLVDFGAKLGGKLEPSWHQNPKNGIPGRCQKHDRKMRGAVAATPCEPAGSWPLKTNPTRAPGTSSRH